MQLCGVRDAALTGCASPPRRCGAWSCGVQRVYLHVRGCCGGIGCHSCVCCVPCCLWRCASSAVRAIIRFQQYSRQLLAFRHTLAFMYSSTRHTLECRHQVLDEGPVVDGSVIAAHGCGFGNQCLNLRLAHADQVPQGVANASGGHKASSLFVKHLVGHNTKRQGLYSRRHRICARPP